MRWNAPPPLIGSWGGSQTGAGVKDMVQDVAKGVGGGVKETFTKASPSELPHGNVMVFSQPPERYNSYQLNYFIS